ncbi:MAG: dTDP-4-dehydrorhamnose 3,5-epimerase [Mesorhizobium sp.]|nr:dTDP-4-dehydrorhamnose 3,5-epimerase [Mesorhizobium sp.]MBL8578937.1 dTDP-4-dehydrorhamnose 3,5-epimerase [Mesorhizobium sp.]
MVEIRKLALDGVYEIVPAKHGDERGFFSETYNAALLAKQGIELAFVQDNQSLSKSAGVLRGLHYQLPPFAQDKLVRVVRGAILDVAVDIRASSPTYGKWLALEVSAEKWNQILVPKGYAHGFVTLVPDTEVIYKVTDRYAPDHERSIRFDDPALGIDWGFPTAGVTLSAKDRGAPLLADAEVFS